MKPSTAGGLTAILGIVACIVQPVITVLTAVGSGLASTPEDRVPAISNTLWAIAGFGTPAAAIALVLLVWRWTKPLALAYATTWAVLVGSYWAGLIFNAGTDWTGALPFLLLESALPLASVTFALYGVWTYRSGPPAER